MKITTSPAEFTTHSAALLRARPLTTRISTTYHAALPGKGTLTLKAYDPVSGAVVKYRTNKVADVGRTVAALRRLAAAQLGKEMLEGEDTVMTETPAEVAVVEAAAAAGQTQEAPAKQGAGRKKKGKKGR